MPNTRTFKEFRETWRALVFSASDVSQLSGIGAEALKKYIRTGMLFTESQYQTTQGKARKFSLGDICQARFMSKLMKVYEMSAWRANEMSWGFTPTMFELAAAHFQERPIDMTLLTVSWKSSQCDDPYGANGIAGEKIQDLMDDCQRDPEFCGLIITRKILWETVVQPCLLYAKSKHMEARRDDALAKS